METKEIILDGKKFKIVTKLDDEYKNDNILIDNLEDTIDLSNINLEDTIEIEIDEQN